MTRGARPGLINLYDDFGDRLPFVSVYVREAHPGERYPHHMSDEQKMRHARDWAHLDQIPWTVAVDALGGATHNAYGPLPNSIYLIDRTGRVAFRALWAGQEGLLRRKIDELLRREDAGEDPVHLGQQENLLIPLIHGSAEFDEAVARGGEKSKEDFRRELGNVIYGLQKLMGTLEPIVNPGNPPVDQISEPRTTPSDKSLAQRLALGAAAGLAGTLVIQGLMAASQKWLPRTMPPIRQDPGEFMVKRAASALPAKAHARIPPAVETTAARSLAVGYGMTAGALYAAFRSDGADVLTDGTVLGLGTWAAGYLGWLPALGLMPPVRKQKLPEAAGPILHHVLYGIATAAAYRWLRHRI